MKISTLSCKVDRLGMVGSEYALLLRHNPPHKEYEPQMQNEKQIELRIPTPSWKVGRLGLVSSEYGLLFVHIPSHKGYEP